MRGWAVGGCGRSGVGGMNKGRRGVGGRSGVERRRVGGRVEGVREGGRTQST